jgi:hypothetical protein
VRHRPLRRHRRVDLDLEVKALLIPILAVIAIFGVITCCVDENKKHYVGGVSREEIAGNERLVRMAKGAQ